MPVSDTPLGSALRAAVVNGQYTTIPSMVTTAARYIAEADAVLVCAGAGMSVTPGNMVYTNPADFKDHYPWMGKYGYRTAYETMGLVGDPRVPMEAKWGYFATHYHDMRWGAPPNESYNALLRLINDREYFVLTSNVDGCFERAGFDPSRIYTPQGDIKNYQCLAACASDSVFDTKSLMDNIRPTLHDGVIDASLVPSCPRCGSPVFLNLRGGGWFLPGKYEAQNRAFVAWVERMAAEGKKLAIVEVGAGFNTPTVTRFPCESIARDLSGALVRINPTDPEVPTDIAAVGLPAGHEILHDLEALQEHVAATDDPQEGQQGKGTAETSMGGDWKAMMAMLR